MIEQKTPTQTADALASDERAVYLDVRTEGEFVAGHAPGALNVPVGYPDPASGGMRLNPDFVAVVRGAVDAEHTAIYCGCASGIRSQHAALMLLEAGFANVFNVATGFSGKRDPFGRLVEAGWADAGLPVEVGDGGEFSHAALRERARQGDD